MSTAVATQTMGGARALPAEPAQERAAAMPALTGIRFFAALLVVLVHFGQGAVPAGFLRDLAAAGAQGVPLFFVLSGFILMVTYGRRPGFRRRDFYAARLARLYPVYLLGLALALPAATWGGALHGLLVGLSTLFMTQAWLPGVHFAWNGPGWSLGVEVLFYALFPLLCPLALRLNRLRALYTVALAMLATQIVPLAYLLLQPDRGALSSAPAPPWLDAALFNPLVHLPECVTGVLLGRLFLLQRGRLCGAWAPCALAATLLGLALSDSAALPGLMVRDGLLVPLFALLIYALAQGRGPACALLGHPLCVRLGAASYALYILHWPLHDLLGRPTSGAGFWLYVAVLTAVALAVQHGVEEPARRALRQRLARGGERGVPPSSGAAPARAG